MAEGFYEETIHDKSFDASLRPGDFAEFVGQDNVKEHLLVAATAARMRGEALDHVLLTGPPGLGKTTLAHILAKAMGVNIVITSGPVLEKAANLAGILTKLEKGDVFFIDEIHRLQKVVEEYLYPAMEDYRLDIVIDSGPNAHSVKLSLPRFTLVGATTRSGLLTAPLRSRFPMTERLSFYTPADLTVIVRRSSRILKVDIDGDGAGEIARRSRGTPRIANNLLRRVRDYVQIKAAHERVPPKITGELAAHFLGRLEIDEHGLDQMDKRILETLIHKFGGKPVGIGSLAVAVGEEPDTLEEVYEPFLIMEGYVQRTPQGRVPTEKAYKKLGVNRAASQNELL